MPTKHSRRQWLQGAAGFFTSAAAVQADDSARRPRETFGYCLNTSTLMGQKLNPVEIVEIAAKAGYQAIEPWIRELEQHVQKGGNLQDLGRRIRDRGLTVESAIGFTEWLVDDDARRKKGLEETRKAMDLVLKIGGKRLAAPPVGATKDPVPSLPRSAERYRAILELGDQMGVVPEVELWGFSRSLSKLSEVVYVALEAAHPKACVLLDVYHLYKGGSDFRGLKLLSGNAMHVLHFNDYPAQPPRDSITDARRIYPGDGVAPLNSILKDLHQIGFKGFLSLELFNADYWKMDAATVAKTGLRKMKEAVKRAEI